MDMLIDKKNRKFRPLGRRLLALILFFSLVSAVAILTVSSKMDFETEMKRLDDVAEQISLTSLDSVALSMWNLDQQAMEKAVLGFAKLSDVKFVTLIDANGVTASDSRKASKPVGASENKTPDSASASENLKDSAVRTDSNQSNNGIGKESIQISPIFELLIRSISLPEEIVKEIPIKYSDDGKIQEIGKIVITLTTSNAFTRLENKFQTLFFSEVLKTAVFALFFLLLMRFYVTSILSKMSVFLKKIDFDDPNPKIEDRVFNSNARGFAKDEIDDLIQSYNNLSKQNIKYLTDIQEINKDLENRVKIRTFELASKTREIRTVLNSLSQGIFKIDDKLSLVGEYSAFLQSIFEGIDLSSFKLKQDFFDRCNVTEEVKSIATAGLNASFDIPEDFWFTNEACFPREITWVAPSGKEKLLEINWSPVVSSDGMVKEIVVALRDISLLRELELQSQEREEELKILMELLSSDAKTFLRFHKCAVENLELAEATLKQGKDVNQEDLIVLFRCAHTIKGAARVSGYQVLSESVHFWENHIQQVREGVTSFRESYPVILSTQNICQKKLVEYETFARDRLKYFEQSTNVDVFSDVAKIINDSSKDYSPEQILERIRSVIFSKNNYVTLKSFLESFSKTIKLTATACEIPEPKFLVKCDKLAGRTLAESASNALDTCLVHLLSNCVDHGIGREKTREASKKPLAGSVSVQVKVGGNTTVMVVSDDGAGMNLRDIEKIGIQKGLISENHGLSRSEICNLIFLPGFSTSNKVTEVSGRGMGMNIAKSSIEKLGGQIEIQEVKDFPYQVQEGFVNVEFCIRVPNDVLFAADHVTERAA